MWNGTAQIPILRKRIEISFYLILSGTPIAPTSIAHKKYRCLIYIMPETAPKL